MRAGDGGEISVRVHALSPLTVQVQVFSGTLSMGALTSNVAAVGSVEGRKLIMDMVDRALVEILQVKGAGS